MDGSRQTPRCVVTLKAFCAIFKPDWNFQATVSVLTWEWHSLLAPMNNSLTLSLSRLAVVTFTADTIRLINDAGSKTEI